MKYLSLFLVVLFSFSHSLQASNKTIEGYWLTSESIVEVKVCKEFICAEISHVFVEEGVDSSSVLDENNSNKDLQGRALIGINLFKEFKKELISKEVLKGGKIYNPRDGNFYKSTLALLKNGNLKIKGCVLFLCDGEEWQPLEVIFNADGSRQATLKSNQED